MVLLFEPFINSSKQPEVSLNIGLDLFACNRNNKIWLSRHHSLNISIISHTDKLLHVSLCLHNSSVIYCTFIYAKCNHIDRRLLWTDLVNFSTSVTRTWLVRGDLNFVLNTSEYFGTIPSLLPCNEFSNMISDCGLCDTLFIRSMFTSCRLTTTLISKRLDRILVKLSWNSFFHITSVEHLHRALSDHYPFLSLLLILILLEVLVSVSKHVDNSSLFS